ncbi:MAG: succinate dehydrogenase assembly factor 2 [Gammaproteobacteria bacterium]|nr:succinate dehydrogenase assembly factor 2 [Gammaproteobacteria bacterium]MDE0092921.1 succinate dehydrogenase assembly factor 2 [Gammaproteobacteria bacterium]MDE0251408.1 succinate dehydrogenase assembly factor 2 [Gammaproteobacteria bacterium]MDE0401909.1 succinate dehydrogenase assembly factor 2 [Gammaproteobacteria bacterium]
MGKDSNNINEVKRRMLYRSRRGMLELDLLLVPFVENRFENLASAQQQLVEQLLNLEDIELHELIQRPERRPEFQEIIELIVQYRQQQSSL